MSITLRHPLPGSRATDKFGWRAAIPSIGLPAQLHNGQDYAAAGGTPILAAHDGTVVWVGWDNIGGGWGVKLRHKSGWETLYFHMRERSWRKVGERVVAGKSYIGHVGATGMATGNHLHFMLRLANGRDVDPVPYIKAAPKPKPKPKGLTVLHYYRKDKDARSKGRTIAPGKSIYLNTKSGGPSNAANIVGGVGPYSITPHVYANGTAGDALELVLIWQNKNRRNSRHFTERIEFDRNGLIRASREFKRAVASGFRVFARLEAPSTNKGNVKVTLFDSDAYLIK